MKFDSFLENQKTVVKLLQNSLKKHRLVHTYLFEGAKGTEKIEGAYYLASLIMCTSDNKPCMKCEDCHKILKEDHPSIFYIEPENGVIRKEQIDRLEKEFSMTSISGENSRRVYIIRDIDLANASAANSLLKFLEEMGGDNYGILTTENIFHVLPTIRSRSQIVTFSPAPRAAVASQLETKGVDKETSQILAAITNNAEDCLHLINEGKILDIIDLAKKVGIAIATQNHSPILIMNREGNFLLKDSDKKNHMIFLDLLMTLANDKMYYALQQTDKIVFRDTMEVIGNSVAADYERAVREIETILEFKQRMKYNVNLELLYADLLIEIVR